jgi:hypothetical protein
MMDHPGNPLHEGAATGAKAIAELMAAIVMITQIYRQTQENVRASRINTQIQENAARARDEAHRMRLADRASTYRESQWQFALDKGWMRTADLGEAIHVWAAAVPSALDPEHPDVRAMRAMRVAEARIEQIDPEIITRYRKILTDLGADTPEQMVEAMRRARTAPAPAPKGRRTRKSEVVAGELGPVPEAWEAGPAMVGALPSGVMRELPEAPPWPMGAAGWTDGEQSARLASTASTDRASMSVLVAGVAGGSVDVDAPQDALGGMSVRQRLAAAASTMHAQDGRASFMTSPADFSRGTGEVARAGAPVGGQPFMPGRAGDEGPTLTRGR